MKIIKILIGITVIALIGFQQYRLKTIPDNINAQLVEKIVVEETITFAEDLNICATIEASNRDDWLTAFLKIHNNNRKIPDPDCTDEDIFNCSEILEYTDLDWVQVYFNEQVARQGNRGQNMVDEELKAKKTYETKKMKELRAVKELKIK